MILKNSKLSKKMKLAGALVVLVLFACGCGKKQAPPVEKAAEPLKAVEETPAAEPAAEEAATKCSCGKKSHGIMGVLHKALASVELPDEQKKALEALHQGDKQDAPALLQTAKTEFLTTLAAAVKAGSLKLADFEGLIAKVLAAKGALHQNRTEQLNKLHALLTPEQRQAVSKNAKEILAKHGQGGCGCGKHDGKGPHGAGGCPHAKEGGCPHAKAGGCPHAKEGGCPHAKAGGCPHAKEGGCPHAKAGGCPHAKESGCPHAKAGGCPHAGAGGEYGCGGGCGCGKMGKGCPVGKLHQLLEGIQLTPEQQKSFDKLVETIKSKDTRKPEELLAEKMENKTALFDAFEKDVFDSGELEYRKTALDRKKEMMTAHVTNLENLTKMLDEGQRAIVAANIEKRVAKMAECGAGKSGHGHQGHGHGGHGGGQGHGGHGHQGHGHGGHGGGQGHEGHGH